MIYVHTVVVLYLQQCCWILVKIDSVDDDNSFKTLQAPAESCLNVALIFLLGKKEYNSFFFYFSLTVSVLMISQRSHCDQKPDGTKVSDMYSNSFCWEDKAVTTKED